MLRVVSGCSLQELGNGFAESGAISVKAEALTALSKFFLWMGKVESENLPETMGLLPNTEPNLLFAVDDSGNLPGIYALTLDGKAAGHRPIDYLYTHDFEDLAAFVLDGKSYSGHRG